MAGRAPSLSPGRSPFGGKHLQTEEHLRRVVPVDVSVHRRLRVPKLVPGDIGDAMTALFWWLRRLVGSAIQFAAVMVAGVLQSVLPA